MHQEADAIPARPSGPAGRFSRRAALVAADANPAARALEDLPSSGNAGRDASIAAHARRPPPAQQLLPAAG
jgi:hypothetical protein